MQSNKSKRELQPIFVHSETDELGLSPFEFRVYGHLARRAGESVAWPGIRSVARICRMTKSRVSGAIKELLRRGLITGRFEPKRRSYFHIAPRSRWVGNCPDISDSLKRLKCNVEQNLSEQQGQQLSEQSVQKEIQQGDPVRSLASRKKKKFRIENKSHSSSPGIGARFGVGS